MTFRQKAGFGIIGLALFAGGYGLSELRRVPKGNISSTTTIMPPAANNSTALDLTMTPSSNVFQPAKVYVENLTNAGIKFNWTGMIDQPVGVPMDNWVVFTIKPANGPDKVDVTLTVTGNPAENITVARAPATKTNGFVGYYFGDAGTKVIIEAGDANLFQ